MASLSIHDIARLANVSASTVSRVINNRPDVNPVTRSQVLKIIQENSFVPNNSARSLRQDSFHSIGVLIKGVTNPFFTRMIHVIEQKLEQSGYSIILHNVEEKEDEVNAAARLVRERKPKGLIFLGGSFVQNPEELERLEIPFVLVTASVAKQVDRSRFSSVAIDDYQEAYKAVDYICKQGHTRIALIGASVGEGNIAYLRQRGYLAALRDNGITPDPALMVFSEDFSLKEGYKSAVQLLERQGFTCIFCLSDMFAIGACKALDDKGCRIPEDISVFGFDGVEIGRYYTPTLATVMQPDEEMAYESVRIILGQLESGLPHEHLTFPARLVPGKSFRPLV